MSKVIISAFAALAICVFSGCATSRPPIHQSDAAVRAWVLTRTPVGSNLADVRTTLIQNGWLGTEGRNPPVLYGHFGEYIDFRSFPFQTNVGAEWRFDRKNRLQIVIVHRSISTP